MAVGDTLRELFLKIKDLNDRVLELESEHGEVASFHFGSAFPSSPYPNQIIIRTDESPPLGGVMYRYDQASSSWARLN